jgi:hypothetical protein
MLYKAIKTSGRKYNANSSKMLGQVKPKRFGLLSVGNIGEGIMALYFLKHYFYGT